MLLTAAVVALLPVLANALYSSRDEVIELTPANWQSTVETSKHAFLVEFYAPWCGHCKALVPEYKKAAESLRGLAKVGAIDCDAHRDFCGRYGISGFPTIKLFESNKKKPPVDYNYQRTSAALVEFTVPYIDGGLVSHIGNNQNRASVDDFFGKNALPKVLLFNKKYSVPPLYKALSIDFESKVSFGEIKVSEEDLIKRFNVQDFPTVLVFPNGTEEQAVKYDGAMKHAALSDYFKKIASGDGASNGNTSGPSDDEGTSHD